MKKITSLFYTLFIILLLSACADVAAQTISSDGTEPNEQQINSNATSSSESNSLVSELESLIGLLRNQVTELKNQNNTLDSQIQSLNNKIDELKEENMSVEDDISSLNSEIAGFTNKNTEFIIEISNLEEEITELENKSIELNDKIEYLEDEIVVGTTSNYNKSGKFYERLVTNMVDCSQFHHASSSDSLGVPILIDFPEDDVCFICEVEDGVFYAGTHLQIQREKKIVLYPEPNNYWYTDDDLEHHADTGFWWASTSSNNQKQQDFIQVIITKEDHIIGYAVIKIQILGPATYAEAITLKSVVIPRIGDEYQNVTTEQVELAINEIKLLNTPVEEE